jgi:thioredoxin reductase (NADPH)
MSGDSRYDIVVAGGGLAGMSAGITAARLGRSVLILTGGLPGGLLLNIERIDGLPGFPDGVPGYELCPAAQEQAESAGAQLSMSGLDGLEPSDGGWALATGEGVRRAGAVIVATGASFKALGVPGEEKFQGRGISTCASCDGPLLRGKTTVVAGGGDSALQEALTLADAVERVMVLHRGEELDAQAAYRERVAQHPKIEVRFRTVIEEILGEDTVRAVRVRGVDSDAGEELEAAAVFPFVGLTPNTEALEGITQMDPGGHVLTDGALRTEREGLLAAGIVRSGATGRAAAVGGEGATAALTAHRYLDGQGWPDQIELARTGAGSP